MDSIQGVVDAFEKLLYDVLGLLLPGGVLLCAGARVLGGDTWTAALAFAGQHPWLSVATAYLVGLALQGLSRPLVNLCRLPGRGLRAVAGSGLRRAGAFLQSGHRATREDRPTTEGVDLLGVLKRYWSTRVPLEEGEELSRQQVVDLSFSAILDHRRQLDRFRAATSLARGVAAALVPVVVVLGFQLAAGLRPRRATAFVLLGALLVAIYGLIERADWYAGLWRSVLHSQAAARVFPATATDPEKQS